MRAHLTKIGAFAAIFAACLFGCSRQNPDVRTAFNRSAALVGDLPYNPLQWRVITSWANTKDSTMSTLYGNDAAVSYARTNLKHNYPAGALLALVTWHQQADPRWFGGRIPADLKSVEFVTIAGSSGQHISYEYQEYEGSPLKRVSIQQSATPNDRIAFLMAQRAAVFP